MSKGSSGQHGGLCLRGSQGRIPGCPRDPLDNMGSLHLRGHQWRIPGCPRNPLTQHGQLCEMDMKGGSWDVLKILDPPKSERTRLDCLIWHERRILGCHKNPGSSQDWKDKVRLSEESRTFVGNTGHECFHTNEAWANLISVTMNVTLTNVFIPHSIKKSPSTMAYNQRWSSWHRVCPVLYIS